MPFATYEDVQARLGRPLSAAEQTAATVALAEAESAVQVYTGQQFNPGTATQHIVSVTGSVMLAQRPVKALTAFRVVGRPSDVTRLLLVGNIVNYLPVHVPVEIDYTYGYDVVPQAIKGITVRAALRAMTNPTGVVSFTIGGYTETRSTNSDEAASVFGVSDVKILDRYRLPQARTVFMGGSPYRRDPSTRFQGPEYGSARIEYPDGFGEYGTEYQ